MESLPLDSQTLCLTMKETSTYHLFEDLVLFFSSKKIQNEIVPSFIEQLQRASMCSVFDAIQYLHESMRWFYDYVLVHQNAKNLKSDMNDLLKACLKWNLQGQVIESLKRAYTFSFQFYLQDFDNLSNGEGPSKVTLHFREENEEVDVYEFKSILKTKFVPMVQQWLVELGLSKVFRDDIIVSILKTEIDRYVVRTCSKQYEQSWLGGENDILGKWTKSRVFPWLKIVFHGQFDKSDWEEKLLYVVYNSYTTLRISEMLNIITDYPDSIPVLQDLKLCLQHTRQRPTLINSLKQEINNRVLHPGVSTQNIITVYIAAVKALRELDVSGVVMETVLDSCKAYLTQREDSVRVIMQGLLWDDGSNDLAAELASNEKQDGSLTIERVTSRPEDWTPDPREADPRKSDRSSRTSDIVTLFIGMYGSKEKFIKEYQKLLSKRLLQTWCDDQNVSAEIRNLELLKKRFGEEEMSKCAVMLKDIADSRRINSNIKEERKNIPELDFDLSAMIVSSEFWPETSNQDFELPPSINDTFTAFNKEYESLKVSRSLKWLHSLGTVDIELEFADRTVEVKVTPLQAAIIWNFQDKDSWTLDELGDQLKIPPTVLRRKMTYWIQQGLIKQTSTDNYQLIEESESTPTSSRRFADNTERVQFSYLDAEEDDDEEKNSDQKEKSEQVMWNYVQGMLKNFESLQLDRIHKMLQMFVMHDDTLQIDLPQLRSLLSDKIKKGQLVFENGKYKLVRDTT